MANAQVEVTEIRFKFEPELTQMYIYHNVIGGDAPITVQGWHHKTFPARMNAIQCLETLLNESSLLWPLAAP